MSVVSPPLFNTSIFNNNAFQDSNSTLTLEEADLRYLKLTGGALSGSLSLNNELNVIRTSNGEAIRCNNGTVFSALHLTSTNSHIGTTSNHNFNIQSNGNNVIQCLTSGACNIVNSLQLGGTTITATANEINYLDITTIGFAEASKALVVDSNRDLYNIRRCMIGNNTNLGAMDLNISNTNSSCAIRLGSSYSVNNAITMQWNYISSGNVLNNFSFDVFGVSNQMVITAGGNIGIGFNTPSFKLHLINDSAAKPSTSSWFISSDERIKENIEDANLDICYNNIKNLKLKRYKYKDNFIENHSIEDKHKLGWIAQEVKTYIPKAVSITQNEDYNIEDCHSLNTDQIITCMYGAVQKLIEKYEQHDKFINSLEIE